MVNSEILRKQNTIKNIRKLIAGKNTVGRKRN